MPRLALKSFKMRCNCLFFCALIVKDLLYLPESFGEEKPPADPREPRKAPLCWGTPWFAGGTWVAGPRGAGKGRTRSSGTPNPSQLALMPEQAHALTFRAQDAWVAPKPTRRVAEEPVFCCRCRTGWQRGPRVGSGPVAKEVVP